MPEKIRAAFASRAFRQGSVASAITILFVALVLALNLFAGVLAQRNQWRLDLTATGAFVLTEQSREFLAGLEVDVTIYVLTTEATLTAAGANFFQANEIIRQYAALSPQITVEYIDLTRQPAFAARFPQFQLNAHTILLVSEERVEPVSIFELFDIETDGFRTWIASHAEQVLTGALLFLSMEELTTIGVLTGFGKPDPGALVSLLETNRYRVVFQNLLTQEIDPDIDMLVIYAPTADYPEHVIAALERFLQGERDVSILYFASAAQPPLPNLEAFLRDWGIIVNQGLVYQPDTNETWGTPFISTVHYREMAFARHALDFISIMPNARPLDRAFNERGQRISSAPLIFGEGAVLRPPDADESWTAPTYRFAPFPAILISRELAYLPEGSERVSTLAVFASADFVDRGMLLNPYIGNAQYMIGLVQTLAGQEIDLTTDLAIAPAVIGISPLPVTDFQVFVFGVLLVIALPLAVVLAGAAVFLKRRYM